MPCPAQYRNGQIGCTRAAPAARIAATSIRLLRCGEPRADANLREVSGLATARRLRLPNPEQQRHAEDAEQRVDRLVPGNRDPEAANVECHMLLDPHRKDIRELVVGDRLEDGDQHHRGERQDDAPVGGTERASLMACAAGHVRAKSGSRTDTSPIR